MAFLDWLYFVFRISLGGYFLAYGLSKTLDNANFKMVVKSYKLTSDGVSIIVARTLPLLEITLGLVLLFDIAAGFSALAIGFLLVVFSLIITINIVRRGSSYKDCGCGGSRPTAPKLALLRNVLLFIMAIIISLISIIGVSQPFTNSLFILGVEVVFLALITIRSLSARIAWLYTLFSRPKHFEQINGKPLEYTGRRNFVKLAAGLGIGLMTAAVFVGQSSKALADFCSYCYCTSGQGYTITNCSNYCSTCEPACANHQACNGSQYNVYEKTCCDTGATCGSGTTYIGPVNCCNYC